MAADEHEVKKRNDVPASPMDYLEERKKQAMEHTTIQISRVRPVAVLVREPCLFLLTGFEAGRIYPLGTAPRDRYIGRSSECDITIDSPEISRIHAQIKQNPDGSLRIIDKGSVNGIFVNNNRVTDELLRYDDKIQIGPYVLLKLVYHDQEEIEHLRQFYAHATSDYLTGLLNRRSFMQTLRQEWSYAQRDNGRLSLAMIDIDHFKSINDEWGHPTGDVVLVEFALRVREQIRLEDYLARFGGEEFVILMRNSDEVGAMVVAERARKSIADQPFDMVEQQRKVTVSIGLASFGPEEIEELSPEDFVREADRQLYRAKDLGRNRVCVRGC